MSTRDFIEKDYYAALGVPKDADAAAIKKAYRKLARELHPDQNTDANAEQRFKEIGEAYAVLSDPEERKQYDAVRSMSGGGARFTAGGPGGGAGFEDVFSSMFGGGGGNVRFQTAGAGPGAGPGANPNLEDLLGGMFGPGAGQAYGGFGAPAGPRKGADISAQTPLSYRDAVEGATVTLATSSGGRITTRIPAGVKDGQRIRLRGKGGEGEAGAPDGDLILTVHVSSHPVFGRDGDNLTIDLPVTFAEAALGAIVSVPTLSGSPVKVKIPAGTPSERVLRVKGRGVSRNGKQGDLLAKVNVIVPQRLTDEARAALEALRSQEGEADPRAELFARAGD